ncbi:hypothetical protein BJY52DRAFT_18738 [Lactarius psammicola]|nr:hypothetical protein BJY52DRAFT_18738 [Lactarius psammicola]
MEDLQPNEARLLRKGATKAPTVRASTVRRRAEYIPNNRRPVGSSSKNFFGASTRTPRDAAFSRANLWTRPNGNKDKQRRVDCHGLSPSIPPAKSMGISSPGHRSVASTADGRATIVSAVARFPDTPGSTFEAQREPVAPVTTHKHLNDFRPPYRLTHRYCHPAGGSGVPAFSRGSGSPLSPIVSLRTHSSPNKVSSTNQGHSGLRPARCLSRTTSATEQSEFSAQMNSPWIRSSGEQDDTSKQSPLVSSAADSWNLQIPRSNSLSNDRFVFLSGTLVLLPSKVMANNPARESDSHPRGNRVFLPDIPPTTTC